MATFLSLLYNVPMILASLGLIIATSSFISGLQLVRGTSAAIEGKIHRLNGVLLILLYIILAITWLAANGITLVTLISWVAGINAIFLKLWIVRVARKRRRAFKYVSWFGASLTLMWIYIVYIHLPL